MKSLDNYSSVKLSAMLALPKHDVRDFVVASGMGTWVPASGHAGPLRKGEPAVASTVNRSRRVPILEVLQIKDKTWQNKMSTWVSLRLAHNCSTQIDCLFVEPLEGAAAVCPGCRQELGPSRNGGTDLPGVGESPSRSGGRSECDISGLTGANGDVPNKVLLRGEGEGGTGLEPQEPRLTPRLAQHELAKAALQNRAAEEEAMDLVHAYLGDKEDSV